MSKIHLKNAIGLPSAHFDCGQLIGTYCISHADYSRGGLHYDTLEYGSEMRFGIHSNPHQSYFEMGFIFISPK